MQDTGLDTVCGLRNGTHVSKTCICLQTVYILVGEGRHARPRNTTKPGIVGSALRSANCHGI